MSHESSRNGIILKIADLIRAEAIRQLPDLREKTIEELRLRVPGFFTEKVERGIVNEQMRALTGWKSWFLTNAYRTRDYRSFLQSLLYGFIRDMDKSARTAAFPELYAELSELEFLLESIRISRTPSPHWRNHSAPIEPLARADEVESVDGVSFGLPDLSSDEPNPAPAEEVFACGGGDYGGGGAQANLDDAADDSRVIETEQPAVISVIAETELPVTRESDPQPEAEDTSGSSRQEERVERIESTEAPVTRDADPVQESRSDPDPSPAPDSDNSGGGGGSTDTSTTDI